MLAQKHPTLTQVRLSQGWQKRQAHIAGIIWGLILILPFAALSPLVLAATCAASNQSTTGDPLVDDFIRLCESRIYTVNGGRYGGSLAYAPLVLSAREAELLKLEHAADPRVRELLDLVGIENSKEPGTEAYGNDEIEITPALLRQKISGLREQWLREAQKRLHLPKPGSHADSDESSSYWRSINAELLARHGDTQNAYLQQLKVLSPDDANAWYLEAIFAAQSGELKQAFEALRIGNAKPHCTSLAGCPFETYYELCLQGREPKDKTVGALLTRAEFWRGSGSAVELRGAYTFMADSCIQDMNLERMQLLHLALCRQARAEGVSQVASYIACTQLNELANNQLPLLLGNTKRQQHGRELLELANDAQGLQISVGQLSRSSAVSALTQQSQPASGSGLGALAQNILSNLGLKYRFAAAEYDDSLAWRKAIQGGGNLNLLIVDLETFDYTSLSFTSTGVGAARTISDK